MRKGYETNRNEKHQREKKGEKRNGTEKENKNWKFKFLFSKFSHSNWLRLSYLSK